MKSGVYKITNIVNGKFYIGSSNNIHQRWNEHRSDLRRKIHSNPKLQHAWDFYGEDKFTFEIIEETDSTPSLIFEREQHYLDVLKPHIRNVGYNLSDKACGGDNFTNNPNKEEIRKKLRKASLGKNNGMYHRKHTDESVEKQKEKAKGKFSPKWFTDRNGKRKGMKMYRDRIQFLKQRKDMNYSYDNGMSGIKRGPMSQENKNRISEAKKRLKLVKVDLMKDIYKGTFTIIQLSEKYKLSVTTIKYYRKIAKKNP